MKNNEIYDKWTNFISGDKYGSYFINNKEQWYAKLKIVENYIDKYNKRPSKEATDNEIAILGRWVGTQKKNYKNKTGIMANVEIYEEWTKFINKYKGYFLIEEEQWEKNFISAKNYIDKYNKRPLKRMPTSNWLYSQSRNYQKKTGIMKNKQIYDKWENFINDAKYQKYFINNEKLWEINLIVVKKYIDKNKKRPSSHDKNNNIALLGKWIVNQNLSYKNKIYIMKNKKIYDEWTSFINDNKYKEFFNSIEDNWENKLNCLKTYIDKNNKKPSEDSKCEEIKVLGKWTSHQNQNYKNKTGIMKNKEICNKWTDFINDNKYMKYFMDEEQWEINFTLTKNYMDKFNKRPSKDGKNDELLLLMHWVLTQNKNYKNKSCIMKNKEIYDKWEKFINDDKYRRHFLNSEELWIENLQNLKIYIDKHNKKPSIVDKCKEINKLSSWMSHQVKNYKNKTQIMGINKKIYNLWHNFINDDKYKCFFNN